ncbi:MAG: hypothetical protein VW518_01935 [Burkholderiaceae bacterium]
MANEIERVEPPAIPLATEEYNRPFMDQFSNVFRLFFNRLNGVVSALTSRDDGGKFLYMPRGLFYSTVNQTAAVINTGYPVEFENTYIGNGVSIAGVDSTRITVTADGVYNFQVTLTIQHTISSDATIWTWINKNGSDVAYGGQKQTIKGNGDKSIYWNFSIDVEAGQYIEMYWAVDDLTASIHTEAPTSPHPGIPSTIVAVSFVSNL